MSKTADRADLIMKALLRAGELSVPELVTHLKTSAPSVRRDLTRLEKRGLVLRTHGGVKLVAPLLYEPFRHDTSFQAREGRSIDQKRRIGLAGAELVKENDVIGLTAGTTTTQIGRALRHRRGLTVVTNAVNIGMELCNQPAIKTMLTGGTLAWAWTFALSGHAALNYLRELYLNLAFISATGFDLEFGVTTLEPEEAAVATTMLRRAQHVVVVVDSAKFGHVGPALICNLDAVHTLITDTEAPEVIVQAIRARNIRVLQA